MAASTANDAPGKIHRSQYVRIAERLEKLIPGNPILTYRAHEQRKGRNWFMRAQFYYLEHSNYVTEKPLQAYLLALLNIVDIPADEKALYERKLVKERQPEGISRATLFYTVLVSIATGDATLRDLEQNIYMQGLVADAVKTGVNTDELVEVTRRLRQDTKTVRAFFDALDAILAENVRKQENDERGAFELSRVLSRDTPVVSGVEDNDFKRLLEWIRDKTTWFTSTTRDMSQRIIDGDNEDILWNAYLEQVRAEVDTMLRVPQSAEADINEALAAASNDIQKLRDSIETIDAATSDYDAQQSAVAAVDDDAQQSSALSRKRTLRPSSSSDDAASSSSSTRRKAIAHNTVELWDRTRQLLNDQKRVQLGNMRNALVAQLNTRLQARRALYSEIQLPQLRTRELTSIVELPTLIDRLHTYVVAEEQAQREIAEVERVERMTTRAETRLIETAKEAQSSTLLDDAQEFIDISSTIIEQPPPPERLALVAASQALVLQIDESNKQVSTIIEEIRSQGSRAHRQNGVVITVDQLNTLERIRRSEYEAYTLNTNNMNRIVNDLNERYNDVMRQFQRVQQSATANVADNMQYYRTVRRSYEEKLSELNDLMNIPEVRQLIEQRKAERDGLISTIEFKGDDDDGSKSTQLIQVNESISRLETRLEQAQTKNFELRKAVFDAKNTIMDQENAQQVTMAEIKAQQNKIEELNAQLAARTQTAVVPTAPQILAIRQRISALEKDRDNALALQQESEAKSNDAERRLTVVNSELATVRSNLEQTNSALASERLLALQSASTLATAQASAQASKEITLRLSSEQTVIQGNLDRITAERDNIQRQLDEAQRNARSSATENRVTVENLQAKLTRRDGRVNALRETLRQKQVEIDANQATVKELLLKNTKLEESNKAQAELIEKLEKDGRDALRRHDELVVNIKNESDAVKKNKIDADEKEQVAQTLRLHIAQLEGQLNASQETIEKLELERARLLSDLTNMTKQAKEDVERWIGQPDYKEIIDRLNRTISEMQTTATDAQHEYDQVRANNATLQAEIDRLNAGISENEARIDELTKENAQKTEMIVELEEKITELEALSDIAEENRIRSIREALEEGARLETRLDDEDQHNRHILDEIVTIEEDGVNLRGDLERARKKARKAKKKFEELKERQRKEHAPKTIPPLDVIAMIRSLSSPSTATTSAQSPPVVYFDITAERDKYRAIADQLSILDTSRAFDAMENYIMTSRDIDSSVFVVLEEFSRFVNSVQGATNNRRFSFWITDTRQHTSIIKDIISAASEEVDHVHVLEKSSYPDLEHTIHELIDNTLRNYYTENAEDHPELVFDFAPAEVALITANPVHPHTTHKRERTGALLSTRPHPKVFDGHELSTTDYDFLEMLRMYVLPVLNQPAKGIDFTINTPTDDDTWTHVDAGAHLPNVVDALTTNLIHRLHIRQVGKRIRRPTTLSVRKYLADLILSETTSRFQHSGVRYLDVNRKIFGILDSVVDNGFLSAFTFCLGKVNVPEDFHSELFYAALKSVDFRELVTIQYNYRVASTQTSRAVSAVSLAARQFSDKLDYMLERANRLKPLEIPLPTDVYVSNVPQTRYEYVEALASSSRPEFRVQRRRVQSPWLGAGSIAPVLF